MVNLYKLQNRKIGDNVFNFQIKKISIEINCKLIVIKTTIQFTMKTLISTWLLRGLFSFSAIFCSIPALTQVENRSEDSLIVVTTMDGQTRIGKILSDDGREILLLSKDIGKIYIRKETIKSIVPYDPKVFKVIDNEYRATGPFTTRYYFTTNSLPIKKGENYAMVHLYGPEVHFALSDRFSLGIMSTWGASPFVVAAKYTIPTKNEKVNFGLGTLMGTSGYINTFRGFGGLHWGMITLGDRMTNITLSAGFAYLKTGTKDNEIATPGTYPAYENPIGSGNYYYPELNFSSNSSNYQPIGTAPIIGLGGIAKVGKKASFIFDAMILFGTQNRKTQEQVINYYSDPITYQPEYILVSDPAVSSSERKSTIAFLMPGMRFQTKETRAFQVALAGVIYSDENRTEAFPIPMVSWFFKF